MSAGKRPLCSQQQGNPYLLPRYQSKPVKQREPQNCTHKCHSGRLHEGASQPRRTLLAGGCTCPEVRDREETTPPPLRPRSHLTLVRRVCNFLDSVLPPGNKSLKRRSSVTAQFYLESKGKPSWRCEGMPTQKTQREEKLRHNLGSSFSVLFLLPLGLPRVRWPSQECVCFTRGPHCSLRAFLSSIFAGLPLLCL